jgi:D-beta-D-heptose 7-phosphate kinase/D-beta-D-heptose 1-phosphate adenosyltransferase
MNLEAYRARVARARCLVVGDLILDEYVSGEVCRISPEAPVPVVRARARRYAPGGAANVAAGIRALGAAAALVGVVGADAEGAALLRPLEEQGVDFAGFAAGDRATTLKTRILGNEQQIARIDREWSEPIGAAAEAALLEQCARLAGGADAIVISDYDKGVCTARVCSELCAMAARAGKPVIVDPKRADWARYAGAAFITPNLGEFRAAAAWCGESGEGGGQGSGAAEKLLARYCLGNILITRSHDGMTLVSAAGAADFAADAREVFDVSGAGDTAVAALTAFLSAGMAPGTAARVANAAAGIAVAKAGTCTVTFDDLAVGMGGAGSDKILQPAEAEAFAARCRRERRKVVFTNGCFDILHTGHISYLEAAKRMGDVLIVGLNADASVRRLKGDGRPVNAEQDRARMLCALAAVDRVVLFGEDTPYALIKRIVPDILVKGADYAPESIVGRDIVEANGGVVRVLPLVEGKSTSAVIRSISETAGTWKRQ